jgi:NTP pyrophosphatase (non-canonical NTP hydrolase)
MNFNEFQENCLVTFSPDSDLRVEKLHCMVGVTSEMEELWAAIEKNDTVNIAEEVCDILFYLVVYCKKRNISLDLVEMAYQEVDTEEMFSFHQLNLNNSAWQDAAKKIIFYNREISEAFALVLLFSELFKLAALKEINIYEAMDRLINKLKARYAGKFDQARANNRNLDIERAILEGE